MTDEQKHAHVCALCDAFWRVWQSLLKLPGLMAERDNHKAADANLMAYLDTLPYPPEVDGQTAEERFEAIRAVFGPYSAAVREIAERQGVVKDVFLGYLRAVDDVRELSKRSFSWLPKLAAETHGLGEIKTWTGKLIQSLAWGICDGPSTTPIPEVEEHSRTAGRYWGLLTQLKDITAAEGQTSGDGKPLAAAVPEWVYEVFSQSPKRQLLVRLLYGKGAVSKPNLMKAMEYTSENEASFDRNWMRTVEGLTENESRIGGLWEIAQTTRDSVPHFTLRQLPDSRRQDT